MRCQRPSRWGRTAGSAYRGRRPPPLPLPRHHQPTTPRSSPVTPPMLRPRIPRPIPIIMAQIPWLAALDQITTPSTPNTTRRHQRNQHQPSRPMRTPIARLLLSRQNHSIRARPPQSLPNTTTGREKRMRCVRGRFRLKIGLSIGFARGTGRASREPFEPGRSVRVIGISTRRRPERQSSSASRQNRFCHGSSFSGWPSQRSSLWVSVSQNAAK